MQFLTDYAHNYSLFSMPAKAAEGLFLKMSDKKGVSGSFI